MAKILPYDYRPSNPPTKFAQWHRWITEELHRIAARLVANPVLVAVTVQDQPIDISPVLSGIVLGIGVDPIIDEPGGSYDPLTGEWTCPLDGIYTVSASVAVDPFGTGNKAWEAYIRVLVDGVLRFEQGGSGVDDVSLFINFNIPMLLNAPDKVTFELWTIHDQFTGVTEYDYRNGITRVGVAL